MFRPRLPRRRLLLERLHQRQLMAGDVGSLLVEPSGSPTAIVAGDSGSRVPQGEPGVDLVQFAQDLSAAGVTFYGAHWCPVCTQQKELFEDGGQFLPFIEVTRGDRTQDPLFASLNITAYPTWVFAGATEDFNGDGVTNEADNRLTGVQTLETLSRRSGVPIPMNVGERPFFVPIGDLDVSLGSPVHVAVDGYDPEGGPLTVSVTVADPELLEAVVLTGNRSLRLDMDGFGDMVFELFDDKAPVAAGRVATLAQNNFYDGIIFHRVIDGFVIQGGDPTGTGTSGSALGTFDDNFHPDLQHTGPGVLSFAKADDDTNNSQFFITEVATQSLDFNHSIFGQLVEGDDVREAISNMQVNSSDKPVVDIRINNATVFNDDENAVIMFKPRVGTGSTQATITITDAQRNVHSETITINLLPDTVNAKPYLGPIVNPIPAISGSNATVQLTSIDLENDAVNYGAQSDSTNITGGIGPSSGLLEVRSLAGFVGTADVLVGVQGNSPRTEFDTQFIRFQFISAATATPTSIDLMPISDTGALNTDNVTSSATLQLSIGGVIAGGLIEVINLDGDVVLGSVTATGSTAMVTIDNPLAPETGMFRLAARQRLHSATSPTSPELALTVIRTLPFHDPLDRFNVNRVDSVTALDALIIINVLNDFGGEVTTLDPLPNGLLLHYVYDVSGDGKISALDALQVINELNRLTSQGEPIESIISKDEETWAVAIDQTIGLLF